MVASGSAHELLTIWEVADWIQLGGWLTKLTRVTSANEGIERSHKDPPVGRGRDKHQPMNRREFRERGYWSATATTKAVITITVPSRTSEQRRKVPPELEMTRNGDDWPAIAIATTGSDFYSVTFRFLVLLVFLHESTLSRTTNRNRQLGSPHRIVEPRMCSSLHGPSYLADKHVPNRAKARVADAGLRKEAGFSSLPRSRTLRSIPLKLANEPFFISSNFEGWRTNPEYPEGLSSSYHAILAMCLLADHPPGPVKNSARSLPLGRYPPKPKASRKGFFCEVC